MAISVPVTVAAQQKAAWLEFIIYLIQRIEISFGLPFPGECFFFRVICFFFVCQRYRPFIFPINRILFVYSTRYAEYFSKFFFRESGFKVVVFIQRNKITADLKAEQSACKFEFK